MGEYETATNFPGDTSYHETSAEKTCVSPFSRYLATTQSNPPQDHTRDRTEFHSAPVGSPNPASTSYATSTDLLALERKLEVLVAEATTDISSRLLAQIAHPGVATTEVAPAIASHLAGNESPERVACTSAGQPGSSATPMKRRGRKTPARNRAIRSPNSPPEEQTANQKRPRPRMQLNFQMFCKHPIFKFFVNAPVDGDKNPHKWRCRVCHLELSLKTKGSLEILSHYRTEAYLTREHRIRMETPGLPLFDSNELELVGPALEEARAKAELELLTAPTLGECYLMPGQRRLPDNADEFYPSAVVCSQIRILLTALENGGTLSSLISLWTNLGLEIRGPARVPQ